MMDLRNADRLHSGGNMLGLLGGVCWCISGNQAINREVTLRAERAKTYRDIIAGHGCAEGMAKTWVGGLKHGSGRWYRS